MCHSIYRRFLIAEILVIPLVTIIFKVVANRILAGALAGALFAGLGLYIVLMGWRVRAIRRSVTFPVAIVHLCLVALPLTITRLAQRDLEFDQVLVWGLPGPVFHRLSTAIYVVLLGCTIFDLWRSRREDRHAARVR